GGLRSPPGGRRWPGRLPDGWRPPPYAQGMALDPDALAATSFPAARKGVDPEAVKRLLRTVAEELRQARATEAELRASVASLTEEAKAAQEAKAAPVELDEATATELLGQEAARVL